jgi:alpha-glucosidase (family GH31 glycosyl hydrolase)
MVPAAVSAGLAGYAYWFTEVGGYIDGVADPASERDLYLRWLELGAFTAMLRDQYGDRRGQPTYLFSDAETIDLWRRYARIHQALGPYLWNAAQQARTSGLPLMRHLAIPYPDDPRAWAEEQQYMLGDDLLVAPVIEPFARERSVYLPRGAWTHWWSGRTYLGPADVAVPAPRGQIPVFVRGGASSPLPDPASFGG